MLMKKHRNTPFLFLSNNGSVIGKLEVIKKLHKNTPPSIKVGYVQNTITKSNLV